MTFSEALEEMRKGKKIYRPHWECLHLGIEGDILCFYAYGTVAIHSPSLTAEDILYKYWRIAE